MREITIIPRLIESQVLAAIHRYRQSSEWHDPADHPFDFHASEVGEPCLRKLFFKRMVGKDYPESNDSLLLFEVGNVFHRYIQSLFDHRRRGTQIEVPVKIKFKDFNIVGRADLLFDGVVYELKTVSRLPHRPCAMHEKQVEVYLRGLHKRTAVLVYILKRDFKMLEFVIERDDLRWKEIKLRTARVVEAIRTKVVPEAHWSYACRYCSFQKKCKSMRYY